MKQKIIPIFAAAILFCSLQTQTPALEKTSSPKSASKSIMFNQNVQKIDKEQRRKEFEQRLGLTEEQKQEAKKIHEKGKDEIQPIIMKIEVKRQQLHTIKLSNLSDEEQAKQTEQVKSELKALEKQAREIRKKNSEEFEKILTKDQKTELEKMKAEGRAKFEQSHKARPPFQGLGSPIIYTKPVMPPPKPVME